MRKEMKKAIHEKYYKWADTPFSKSDDKLLKEAGYSIEMFDWLSGFKAGVKWAKQNPQKRA